jgi:predicted DNA-binding protein (UPF0251 family)
MLKDRLPLTDENLKTIEILAGRGLTQTQIAGWFGVSKQTFANRMKEFTEIRRAMNRGKSVQIAHVAGKLIEQINAGSTSATIFFLKTQAGWKDGTQIVPETREPINLNISTSDPNEAARIYQDIMRGKGHERNSASDRRDYDPTKLSYPDDSL